MNDDNSYTVVPSGIEVQLGAIMTTQRVQTEQIADIVHDIRELKDAVIAIQIELAETRGKRAGASMLAALIGGIIGTASTAIAMIMTLR